MFLQVKFKVCKFLLLLFCLFFCLLLSDEFLSGDFGSLNSVGASSGFCLGGPQVLFSLPSFCHPTGSLRCPEFLSSPQPHTIFSDHFPFYGFAFISSELLLVPLKYASQHDSHRCFCHDSPVEICQNSYSPLATLQNSVRFLPGTHASENLDIIL